MKKGDKVRVRDDAYYYKGRYGVVKEPCGSVAWWVDLGECTTNFFEHELEVVASTQNDDTNDAKAHATNRDATDLTGKRVRVKSGYWLGHFGKVVGLSEKNEWEVDMDRVCGIVSFPAKKLEVVDDLGEPTTRRKYTPKKKARTFTPDELQTAYNGDYSPADNAIVFACDMWTLLLAEAERNVTWNDGRLEVVR